MNAARAVFALWLLMPLLLAASGCGFQLRGEYALPRSMAVTLVDGDARSVIVRGLERNLRASQVSTTSVAEDATAILRVFDERTGRRVVAVGSDGDVTEYEVYYSVSFRLDETGAERGEAQTLRLTRDYVFDAQGVLSSSEEEATLRGEMQRDLVRLILLRLQARP